MKKINPLVRISLLTSESDLDAIPDSIKENTSEVLFFRDSLRHHIGGSVDKLIKRVLFLWMFICLSNRKYDIVNIHFARPSLSHALHWINKMSKHIVISPWGSDVLRVEGEKKIEQLRRVYAAAQYVTIGRKNSVGERLINVFNVSPDKLINLGWGGEFFDFIQENSGDVTTEEAKARFGMTGKYVITCGYNTQPEQRHEAIIDAIHSVRNLLPDNMVLLFPFTYGRSEWSDGYTGAIKEKARGLGFEVVSVEENLGMADLLKLRMATDIFVHIQATDSSSRCVMEYVACNKKVVHGAWVDYPYLEKYRPSCYFPVNRLESLGECIVKAYHTEIGPLHPEVRKIILERGWKHKMTMWNNFFESLV